MGVSRALPAHLQIAHRLQFSSQLCDPSALRGIVPLPWHLQGGPTPMSKPTAVSQPGTAQCPGARPVTAAPYSEIGERGPHMSRRHFELEQYLSHSGNVVHFGISWPVGPPPEEGKKTDWGKKPLCGQFTGALPQVYGSQRRGARNCHKCDDRMEHAERLVTAEAKE
jgi:hypothetical protein